ncbi:MAG: hypothetical protein EAY75_08460 [Bacteroidetes bacterium]|nr:MAG: hypothetical protein EAY75_08460 [Bacteroidota bacterium]
MQLITRLRVLSLLVLMAFICVACQDSKTFDSPEGYSFNQPQRFELPKKLAEISGVLVKPGSLDSMLAIEDETGKLYSFALGNADLKTQKFGPSADYEDLAPLKNGKVAVLISNGKVVLIDPNAETAKDSLITYVPALPPGEYEAMLAKDNYLFTACKKCAATGEALLIHKFLLPLDNYSPAAETITVATDGLSKKNQKKLAGFEAAAMAIHPLTQDWYLISSTKKLLVILQSNFTFKAAFALDPGLFKQPEGMAFNSRGDLFISNEGAGGKGNILRFNYQP